MNPTPDALESTRMKKDTGKENAEGRRKATFSRPSAALGRAA